MSVLFRRSSFFIDLKTMMAHTDLYVAERLIEMGQSNKLNMTLFTSLIDEYKELGPDIMTERLQAKADINFLLGYLNWDIVAELDEADPIGFCNELYDTLLFQEFDTQGEQLPELKFTQLGNTLQTIVKDSNTEKIYIYMNHPCKYMEFLIANFMCSKKVEIITGNKEEFLRTHTFDSYFLEDVDDVEFISRRHAQRSEIIIPVFPFNVTGFEFDENGDVIYTQDSLFKTPILDKTPVEYLKEYNLDMALINIPL